MLRGTIKSLLAGLADLIRGRGRIYIEPRGPRSNRTCARASVPPEPRLEVAGFYHTHLRVI